MPALFLITLLMLLLGMQSCQLGDKDLVIEELKSQVKNSKEDLILYKTQAYRDFVECQKQDLSPRHSGVESDQFIAK